MNDSSLISMVHKYEELYNPQHTQYTNQQRRDNIWECIGQQLGVDSLTCKEKWQRIRENYRKAISLRKIKRRSAKRLKPPKHNNELSFLMPYLTYEESKASLSKTLLKLNHSPSGIDSPEGEQSDSSASNVSRISRTPTETPINTPFEPPSTLAHGPTIPPVLKNYNVSITTGNTNSSENPHSDTLVDFFITMAKTVKGFPLKKQLEIKSALFQMVHDVEIEMSTKTERN